MKERRLGTRSIIEALRQQKEYKQAHKTMKNNIGDEWTQDAVAELLEYVDDIRIPKQAKTALIELFTKEFEKYGDSKNLYALYLKTNSVLIERAIDVIAENPNDFDLWHALLNLHEVCMKNECFIADYLDLNDPNNYTIADIYECAFVIDKISEIKKMGYSASDAKEIATALSGKNENESVREELMKLEPHLSEFKTAYAKDFLLACIREEAIDSLRELNKEIPKRDCNHLIQDIEIKIEGDRAIGVRFHFLTYDEILKYHLNEEIGPDIRSGDKLSPRYEYWIKGGYVIPNKEGPDAVYRFGENRELEYSSPNKRTFRYAYFLDKQIAPIGSLVRLGKYGQIPCVLVDWNLAVGISTSEDLYLPQASNISYEEARYLVNKKINPFHVDTVYEKKDIAVVGYGLLSIKDYANKKTKDLGNSESWWLAEDKLCVNGDNLTVNAKGAFGNPVFSLRPVLYINPEYTELKPGQPVEIGGIPFTVLEDSCTLLADESVGKCHRSEIWEKLDIWAEETLGIPHVQRQEQKQVQEQTQEQEYPQYPEQSSYGFLNSEEIDHLMQATMSNVTSSSGLSLSREEGFEI